MNDGDNPYVTYVPKEQFDRLVVDDDDAPSPELKAAAQRWRDQQASSIQSMPSPYHTPASAAHSKGSELTLTEFLLARIAEDEKGEHDYWCTWNQVRGGECDCPRKRRLAECEAKRLILNLGPSRCGGYEVAERLPGFMQMRHYPDLGAGGFCDGCSAAESSDDVWIAALRALALPYADHPDYREEWKP